MHEILAVASEENVTLIAIGTVGKNWFREILVGSTTLGWSGMAGTRYSCCGTTRTAEELPCPRRNHSCMMSMHRTGMRHGTVI